MSAGIYIHIPFCKSRCSYCDFATDIYRDKAAVERYINALLREILDFRPECHPPEATRGFDTIYFGGGTPSLLTTKQLEKICKAIDRKFNFASNVEFTLEMNPATVSLEKLKDYKSLGVNRASFGVQTFDDLSLKLLARGHDANDSLTTFKLLRKAKFENISLDLIAGLPNQSLKNWVRNLDKALDLDPEHISLYLLEVHEGTPLAKQIRTKRQPEPDEDLSGEMYNIVFDKLSPKGFKQYEISNYAKPRFESKHNRKYWMCAPVFGFGVSAHSFDGKRTRWANERETNKYVSLIEKERDPVTEHNVLTAKQLSSEFAYLNLRLERGLNLREFAKKFGYDPGIEFADEFANFEKLGLIELDENLLKLTRKGFVYSNEVFSIFV